MMYHQPYDTTKVTLELRDIVDGANPINIWDFDYPSFYEGEEKAAFERKVIDHYYFRQIGCETVGRWLHMFRTRIREIMPYYAQMYQSIKIMEEIEDPFGNVDMVETFEQTTTDTRTGSTSGSSTDSQTGSTNTLHDSSSERRFSNTPQGSISNLDRYMTEATKESSDTSDTTDVSGSSESSSESTSQDNATGTVTYTSTRKGNHGANTYAHDMIEFRQSFINLDMMMIKELADLFLLIY